MKKTTFTKTPRQIAEDLNRYGKLEGIVAKLDYFYKYYSYEDTAVEITCLNNNGSVGEAVSVRRIPYEYIDKLIPSRYKAKLQQERDAYSYKIGGF